MPQDVKSLDDLFEIVRPDAPVHLECLESNVPSSTLTKTPVSILEEGCPRLFDCSPKFSVISEQEYNASIFIMTCRVNSHQTEGKGKSKKVAKQLAASNMLMLLLERNISYAEKFGLSVESLEQARIFIESSIPDTELPGTCSDFIPGQNYINQLTEVCKKNKLDSPFFTQSEEGAPNDRIYTTICQIGDVSAKGQAKQKKMSKSCASYEMLKKIDAGLVLPAIEEVAVGSDVKYKSIPPGDDLGAPISTDPQLDLETSLQNLNLTDFNKEFKMLESRSLYDNHQCMLKISFKNGDTKTTVIFPGIGDTEDDARKCAAKEAILRFSSL